MQKVILRKLALERCQANLAQISALTHLCSSSESLCDGEFEEMRSLDSQVVESLQNAVRSIRADLKILRDLVE